MSFEVNQYAQVINTGEIKRIIDMEQINNVNIVYMSDMTSYSANQLKEKDEVEVFLESLEKFINHERTKKNSAFNHVPEALIDLYHRKHKKNRKKIFFEKILSVFRLID